MPAFWKRLLGRQKEKDPALSLVDYAENYLTVFESGSKQEKLTHAVQLFEAANTIAQSVGAEDFLSLLESSDERALQQAGLYSRQRFDEILTPDPDRYWLATYALTHLIILNYGKYLEDAPRAKQAAEHAAFLYGAEYTRRATLSGKPLL